MNTKLILTDKYLILIIIIAENLQSISFSKISVEKIGIYNWKKKWQQRFHLFPIKFGANKTKRFCDTPPPTVHYSHHKIR